MQSPLTSNLPRISQVMREEANANAERQRQEKLLAKQTRFDRRSRDVRT